MQLKGIASRASKDNEVKILESCTYFGVGPKCRFWDLQSPCRLVGTVLGAPLACLWTLGRLRMTSAAPPELSAVLHSDKRLTGS